MPLEPGATLLVDLDGVVCRQLPRTCEYIREAYGVDVAPEAVDHWSYPIPGHEVHIGEVIVELMTERPGWYFGGMDPVPGAPSALRDLADEYSVEIATHRIPETHDHSRDWLAEHDVPYDAFHEEVPEDKGALPGDALVDDYHGNVADAVAAGKTGFLMRRPYSDPAACEGAHVADSWDDLTGMLL